MTRKYIPIVAAAAVIFLGAFVMERDRLQFSFVGGEGLSIEGTSNVHGWDCETNTISGTFEAGVQNPLASMERLRVSVPLDPVACGSREMDRRMKRAMNADRHQSVGYELDRLTVVRESGDVAVLNTRGRLTINGKVQPIDMQVEGRKLADGRIRFTGTHQLKMSDFDIDPPVAMLGAMRTGNEVTVKFDVTAARR
jgi:polyisoprenoid-binding protein YceI